MPIAPSRNATLPESANWPPATAAAATIEPTDRSMPPVAMTNVIPIASTPMTELWRRTLRMLSLVGKTSGSRIAPAISRRTTTPTSVYSCNSIRLPDSPNGSRRPGASGTVVIGSPPGRTRDG